MHCCLLALWAFDVERGSSAVECRTRNRLCYCFEVWAFLFSPRCTSSLNCINEYLAIDGGGNVSEESARNCYVARMLPEKSSWCRNE